MPKRQPCLGCEPLRNVRNVEQSGQQIWLLCAKVTNSSISIIHWSASVAHVLRINPAFYSRKLFEFACPIHCWASHGSSSNKLPVQHSTYPAFTWKAHDVASKFPSLRCAGFSPRFDVAYLNHFSHTLLPNMPNFAPWIMPANPACSSNQAPDHTSEVDIKFVHIGSTDAPGPSSKTSNWCHGGIEKFQFVSDGHISAQKFRYVGKEGAICRLEMIINIQSSTF